MEPALAFPVTRNWPFEELAKPYQNPVPGEIPAAGTTAEEAAEATEVPNAFVAVTVNVYEVQFVKPFTVPLVEVPTSTLDPPVPAGETLIL